jgi:hypothetical protein
VVAVTPCGPGPSHRVLAVEPCAPTPITIRWCRRRPEALAQRPLDDASDHDAARQVEADDESGPPVDDFLDVVRSAVEDPAVDGHRGSGPLPVLVAALQTQAVLPDEDGAQPCGEHRSQRRFAAAGAPDDDDPVSLERLGSGGHDAMLLQVRVYGDRPRRQKCLRPPPQMWMTVSSLGRANTPMGRRPRSRAKIGPAAGCFMGRATARARRRRRQQLRRGNSRSPAIARPGRIRKDPR